MYNYVEGVHSNEIQCLTLYYITQFGRDILVGGLFRNIGGRRIKVSSMPFKFTPQHITDIAKSRIDEYEVGANDTLYLNLMECAQLISRQEYNGVFTGNGGYTMLGAFLLGEEYDPYYGEDAVPQLFVDDSVAREYINIENPDGTILVTDAYRPKFGPLEYLFNKVARNIA